MEERPTFGFDFEKIKRYCNNAISSDEEKLNYLKNVRQEYEDTYGLMRVSITGHREYKTFKVDMDREIGIVIDRIGYESNSKTPVEEIKSDKIDNRMLDTVNAEDAKKEKIEEKILKKRNSSDYKRKNLEAENIKDLLDETRRDFENFTFNTTYDLNSNSINRERIRKITGIDSVRIFIESFQTILESNVKKGRAFTKDSLNNAFTDGILENINRLKFLLVTIKDTIETIKNSELYNSQNTYCIHSFKKFLRDICFNFIRHQERFVKIEKELLPNAIELCKKQSVDTSEFSVLENRVSEIRIYFEKIHQYCSLIDEVINEKKRSSRERETMSRDPNYRSEKVMRDKVFVSYSHKDKEWLERVQTHLKVLESEGISVNLWDDTKIKAGMKWREEIKKGLAAAKVAILLVSTDFLASDFIRKDELPPLLKAAENDGATILPLILKRCRYTKHKKLSQFQAINDPTNPLSKLTENEQDEILVDMADRIAELMSEN